MAELKKNLAYSAGSTLLQLYSGTIIILFFAKLLEVKEFGDFVFGLSLSGIIATCGEFGYSLMTVRDVPQKRFALQSYVIDVLFQKTIICGIVAVFSLVYLYLVVGSTRSNIWVNCVFVLDGTILSYSMYFTALLQSVGKFNHGAYAVLINAILLSLVVLLLKFSHISFSLLCILFVLTHTVRLLWMIFRVSEFISFRKPVLNGTIQSYLIKNSWSFGLHYVIGVLYFSIDAQIIYILLGNAELALYSSVFRIASLLLIFPDLLLQVFMPYLSAEYSTRGEHFDRVVTLLLKVLVYSACVVSIAICIFDRTIIKILYNDKYLASAPLFVPLLIMCALRSMALVYGMLLTISNNQVFRVKVMIGSLIVSGAANWLFLPMFGVIGAAIASLVTHMFLVAAYVYYTKKTYYRLFFNGRDVLLLLAVAGSLILLKAYAEYAITTHVIAVTAALICLARFWQEAGEIRNILASGKLTKNQAYNVQNPVRQSAC